LLDGFRPAPDFFDDAVLFFAGDFFAVVFFEEALVDDDFFEDALRDGTLSPSLRASEIPIATACFRLVTFLPEPPLFSFPSPNSCITLVTFF
jgi:hypothetical protein